MKTTTKHSIVITIFSMLIFGIAVCKERLKWLEKALEMLNMAEDVEKAKLINILAPDPHIDMMWVAIISIIFGIVMKIYFEFDLINNDHEENKNDSDNPV